MRRHPGRRKTDNELPFAQLVEMGAQTFSAADLFTALDGMTRAREALDMVLHVTPRAPALRSK